MIKQDDSTAVGVTGVLYSTNTERDLSSLFLHLIAQASVDNRQHVHDAAVQENILKPPCNL